MSEIVVCTYRVKPDKQEAFKLLLNRHWPTLRELDLVLTEPRFILESIADPTQPEFVEIFAWRDAAAPGTAHQHPKVLSIWEPMEVCCESRNGRPAMEFPHFRLIAKEASV